MPAALPRACSAPGCPDHAAPASSRCAGHAAAGRREIDSRRGSASSRGYGPAWARLRRRHLAMHPVCVACDADGYTTPATDVDHIIPRARGGTDHASNLQSLCRSCHSRKTALEDGRWGRR